MTTVPEASKRSPDGDPSVLADRLDSSAATLRGTVDPNSTDDDAFAAEACAVADIFEQAAQVFRRTHHRERGSEVNILLWRIVTLERLIAAGVS